MNYKLIYCKARMTAYLNHDLPEKSRRRVARYIGECEECYQEYVRQKNISERLNRQLSSYGMPSAYQLDGIWNHIQTEITGHNESPSMSWSKISSYSVMCLLLVLLVLAPLGFHAHTVQATVGTMPVPQEQKILSTYANLPQLVILATAASSNSEIVSENEEDLLQYRTPEPNS